MINTPRTIERVFVAIDLESMFRGGHSQFTSKYKVDYEKLLSLIREKRVCEFPRELTVIAYAITPSFQIQKDGTVVPSSIKNKPFFENLESLGVKIKNKETYLGKRGKKLTTPWDIGIALDAKNELDSYDTFCLLTSKGDYSLLIRDLRNNGKYTEIITYEKSPTRVLCSSANRIILVTKNEMSHKEEIIHGKSTEENSSKDQENSSPVKETSNTEGTNDIGDRKEE